MSLTITSLLSELLFLFFPIFKNFFFLYLFQKFNDNISPVFKTSYLQFKFKVFSNDQFRNIKKKLNYKLPVKK